MDDANKSWAEEMQKKVAAEYERSTRDPMKEAENRRAKFDQEFEKTAKQVDGVFDTAAGFFRFTKVAFVIASILAATVSLSVLGVIVWGIGAALGKW